MTGFKELRHLRNKLKSGEYDGTDIMAAWAILDEYANLLERAADQPSAVQPEVCSWDQDDEGVWASDCGQQFCLEDEPLPSKHGMKFCHGCGKPLAEHPYVDPPVCGECGEFLENGKCPEGCTTDNQ